MPLAPRSFRRFAVVALASLGLVAATLGLQVAPAVGASPAPEEIIVESVTGGYAHPRDTPPDAVPTALVKAGEAFRIHVRFQTLDGEEAWFTKDTRLVVHLAGSSPDAGLGDLVGGGIAAKGAKSASLEAVVPEPANQVVLTVGVASGQGGKPSTVEAGDSQPFDVLKDIRIEKIGVPGAAFFAGIGGSNGKCESATETNPVCGSVLLPKGAVSDAVLLSEGPCGADGVGGYSGCSSAKGSVIQVLADLDDVTENLYSRTSPATIVMRCDKVLCGGGSIKSYGLSYTLSGKDALKEAPACPAKNTMVDEQTPCVDYVQSTRDGAGDTLLYFLFVKDARVSVR